MFIVISNLSPRATHGTVISRHSRAYRAWQKANKKGGLVRYSARRRAIGERVILARLAK